MIKKKDLKKVLAECMEFFKNELWLGTPNERLAEKYEELRDKCYEALGQPSIYDLDKLKDD